jgi:histo-blood group ABO system transferase
MDGNQARGEQVKTALIVIATGERYHKYIQPLLQSARTYFVPHTPVVFSDANNIGLGERPYMVIDHEEWPGPTLHRYHTLLKAQQYLRCFDQLFYIDVDMLFVSKVGEEIFSDGLTATLHPGFVGTRGTPETRVTSAAFTPNNKAYYCGGFQGGNAESYLSAAETMAVAINIDKKEGITAIWHDESHWNNYLRWFEEPKKILSPSYCYPENAGAYYKDKWSAAGLGEHVEPKILALTKAS